MRMYKKIMILGMSAIILQAIVAVSQANAQDGRYTSLDRNQDGLISLREAASNTRLLENFTRVDINEDGFLSLDELSFSPFLKD